MLLATGGHQGDPATVNGVLDDLAGRMREMVGRVGRCVRGVPYPFAHARGAITLDQFVEPDAAPSQEETEALFTGCLTCLDRLYPLYEEVLGRLAQIAAQVEESLAPETTPGKDGPGAPAADLMGRLREVASRLGPEALAARRPPARTRS